MTTGTLMYFYKTRKFGFIRPDDGSKDVRGYGLSQEFLDAGCATPIGDGGDDHDR